MAEAAYVYTKNTAEILLNQGGSLLQFHPIRPCYKTNNHINELITEQLRH